MGSREKDSRFGACLRQLRLEARVSLREFARATGSDPGNISKIERGLLPPPQKRETLARDARTLGLKEGDEAWQHLSDLAAAASGRISSDLMEREDVREMLPAFFRTIRGEKPTEEDMRRLVQKLDEIFKGAQR